MEHTPAPFRYAWSARRWACQRKAALAVAEAAAQAAASGVDEMLARPAARAALGRLSAADLALISYGGGGGCLLAAVAARAGLGTVYLPLLSPVFSAFGVSTFDVEHSYEARLAAGQLLNGGLAALVAAARRDARGEGFDPGDARMAVSLLHDDGTVLAEDLEPGQVAEHVYCVAVAEDGLAVDRGQTERLRAAERARRLARGRRWDDFHREWDQLKPPDEVLKYYGSWPDARQNREVIRI